MLDVKVRRVIIGLWRANDLDNDPTPEAEAFLFVMNIANIECSKFFQYNVFVSSDAVHALRK
jgi:hypothetical protein